MLEIPDKSLFPGTGPNGNGIPATFADLGDISQTRARMGFLMSQNATHYLADARRRAVV